MSEFRNLTQINGTFEPFILGEKTQTFVSNEGTKVSIEIRKLEWEDGSGKSFLINYQLEGFISGYMNLSNGGKGFIKI